MTGSDRLLRAVERTLFFGLLGCCLLPSTIGADDAFAELERLRAARAAATTVTEQNLLRLQEALLSSLVGLPEAAERLVRKSDVPEQMFLRALLRRTPATPPGAANVDAATRTRVADWLARRGVCAGDNAERAPLLCGGLH